MIAWGAGEVFGARARGWTSIWQPSGGFGTCIFTLRVQLYEKTGRRKKKLKPQQDMEDVPGPPSEHSHEHGGLVMTVPSKPTPGLCSICSVQ